MDSDQESSQSSSSEETAPRDPDTISQTEENGISEPGDNNFTDMSPNTQSNGDDHQPVPYTREDFAPRRVADASPSNNGDLLADDASITSEQNSTKRAWSIISVAFLISAPLFFVGLALVIMGAVGFPSTFNLLPVGIPVFVIAAIVFLGSILFLCVYKLKKMRIFEFGDGSGGGEVATAGGRNDAYVHEEAHIRLSRMSAVYEVH